MERDVTITDDVIRQMVRNVLKTPSKQAQRKSKIVSTIPDRSPPVTPVEPKIHETRKVASLDTSARKGIEMECTLQHLIDTLKTEQDSGMKLAKGERHLKETAAPSSARLLEDKALSKYKSIFMMSGKDRGRVIERAATLFEEQTGNSLSKYETYDDLPDDAKKNVDRWIIDEYRTALIRTGELDSDDIGFIQTDTPDVRHAILNLEGYQQYRCKFWDDVKSVPHSWIFFDEFKAFMKPFWEKNVEG